MSRELRAAVLALSNVKKMREEGNYEKYSDEELAEVEEDLITFIEDNAGAN